MLRILMRDGKEVLQEKKMLFPNNPLQHEYTWADVPRVEEEKELWERLKNFFIDFDGGENETWKATTNHAIELILSEEKVRRLQEHLHSHGCRCTASAEEALKWLRKEAR